MPKSDTATMIELAALGGQFMEIMQDYQERQEDDPNFDPRTRLYDLYDELVFIYDKTNSNLSEQ
jgi:hypothetical protein